MSWLGATIGGVLGLGGNMITNNQNKQAQQRSYRQQRKLMGVQKYNQMELNKQGQELQMQTWRDTNYPAQMGMLKEAGLNPALMYGQGGAGGTTGSQGGGNASGGSAPSPIPYELNLQNAMLASQIELNKANANKANADATITAGANTDLAKTQASQLEKVIQKLGQDILQSESVVKLNEAIAKLKSAEESNVNADTGLKDAQKSNVNADTELKNANKLLADELLNSQKFTTELNRLEKERAEKGFIKGDNIGNMLHTALGLDPANDKTDMYIIRGIMGAMLGSQFINNLSGGLVKGIKEFLKGKPKKIGF